MTEPRVIGIVGLIGSGKGTIGDILKGYGYQPYSFAAKLKDVLALLFSWPREMLEGDTEESRKWRNEPDEWWAKELGIPGFNARMAMQMVGTDAIRNNLSQNIWASVVKNHIQSNSTQKFVITDCRFPNEIEVVRDLGGMVWEVTRGDKPYWYQEAAEYNRGGLRDLPSILSTQHESEWRWIGSATDHEILNNGTFADLARSVECLLKM